MTKIKKLHEYLTPTFWRFNVDFCIQFVAVDYQKLAMIRDGDVDDAFDLELTERTVRAHFQALQAMVEFADKEKERELEIEERTDFFAYYNMIMKRLVLLSHRIDYIGSPPEHKSINNFEEFQKVYISSTIKLSSAHLTNLAQSVDRIDKQNKKEKGKSEKAKVFNFSDLALDRLSRKKEDGD